MLKLKEKNENTLYENFWIDTDEIISGARFVNVIISAINHVDIVMFMYSKEHARIKDINYDWTLRELNFAKTKKKHTIFLNLDKTPLTDWFLMMLGLQEQIDATSDEDIKKLIKDLAGWLIKDIEPFSDNQS